jgi:hypothetical protein
MPRPLWSDGDQVTQADFDSMRERMERQREALKACLERLELVDSESESLGFIDSCQPVIAQAKAALKP